MENSKRIIPFSPPDISEEEIREVSEALRSGWITTGPRTKQLEKTVAGYVGSEKCVCLGSQTACAEMALRLLGIQPGDEIITSAYTYTATASVISHLNAKTVLVDTQKDSYEMDYDLVEAAVTERTKAIIPVDLGGVVCDYDRLFQIVERKKGLFRARGEIQEALGRIAIVADTAHAFGASRGGKMAGTIADFSSFSFHAVKNFTTGEGGALTWNTIKGIDNDGLYRKLQLLSLHGQSKDAFAKTQLGGWEYDIIGTWYKCNMTDIMASIGLAQFRRYPDMLRRRRQIIERYDSVFRPMGLETLPHYTDSALSSGHLYMTRIPHITCEQRNEIFLKMAERGIATNVHFKPLPMFTAYRNMGFDIADFPNAYARFSNELSLPLYTRMTDDDVEYIIEAYRDVLGEYIS